MSRPTVRIASVADIEQRAAAADALAAAFQMDPSWSMVVRDPGTRRSVLTTALSALTADAARRHTLLVALVDGNVVGAAVAWMPGYHPSPFRTPQYVLAAATIVRDAGVATVPLWRRWRAMRTADPTGEPHWHLAVLGVRPDAQHRGIGRALLEAFLKRVEDAGGAAYLETSRPELVAWYAAAGFGVRERLTLPGGATTWTMWRAPTSAHTGPA